MKKYLTLLIFCFAAAATLRSQVVITPAAANSEQMFLENLFQFGIANASAGEVAGVLKIRVEGQAHEPVLEIASFLLTLRAGESRWGNRIEWATPFRYGSNEAAADLQRSGRFSAGNYIICYQFLDLQQAKTLATNCLEQSFGQALPPELVYPTDRQTVEAPPLLTWLPPRPMIGQDICYRLKLVEIAESASKFAAMQRGFVLLEMQNLRGTTLPYPPEALPLEKGKNYAWQVEAFWQDRTMGRTEVWEFSYQTPKTEAAVAALPNFTYQFFEPQLDGVYYLQTDASLHIGFDNRNNLPTLDYVIYEKNGGANPRQNPTAILLQPGLNLIDITMTSLNIQPGVHYVIEARFAEKPSMFYEFKYRP